MCLVIVVLSLQKLTPVASTFFSGISDDVLNDYYDMMSYDLGPLGWVSEDDD